MGRSRCNVENKHKKSGATAKQDRGIKRTGDVNEFVKLAAVFPLNEWGIKLEPMQCLIVVGWIELIGGLLLAIGPRILQEISNIILAVIMMGAIYSLLMLKKPLYMCMPATVCLGLLLLLLYVSQRGREKQKEE
ncbi:transmembrane protein 35B-like isoform X3 [Heterodontus francisci]|uniref:transmembrane protein 35B-like isoform X3 n=1 Tax=Heterodontus francisci TaxID=7792 RepID=UPI00355C6230